MDKDHNEGETSPKEDDDGKKKKRKASGGRRKQDEEADDERDRLMKRVGEFAFTTFYELCWLTGQPSWKNSSQKSPRH